MNRPSNPNFLNVLEFILILVLHAYKSKVFGQDDTYRYRLL